MEYCEGLRERGWMVASHNDYGEPSNRRTYWSFSRGSQFIDGDGATDDEALSQCFIAAIKLEKEKSHDHQSPHPQ